MLFINVFYSSALPIFILLGIGFIVDRLFDLDLQTLSKLSFYIFLPSLLFVVIYTSELSGAHIFRIGAFLLVHAGLMLMLGMLLFSWASIKTKRPTLLLGTLFYNSANFGIPLVTLAYGKEAISIIAVVMTIQLLLFFTLGFAIVGDSTRSGSQALREFLHYPILYVIILGFLMRGLGIMLPSPLDVSVNSVAGAYIPFALILLGIQLSRVQIGHEGQAIAMITIVRLIISPLVAVGLMLLFRFDSLTTQVLIVVSGLPVAVNVYVLSIELQRDAAFASRMVFWTTLASIISAPLMLIALGYR